MHKAKLAINLIHAYLNQSLLSNQFLDFIVVIKLSINYIELSIYLNKA